MNKHSISEFDYLTNSASPTDCTGLIPEGPIQEFDLNRFQEVYHFGTKEMIDTIEEDVIGKDDAYRYEDGHTHKSPQYPLD